MSLRHSPADDARLYVLVLRCQSGDDRAFADLMELFGQRTLAHLRGLLGDAADDAQQDVWLTVYRRVRSLTHPGAFRTWLFQMTRHRAIDALRARKRERELVDDAGHDPDTVAAPDDAVRLEESGVAAALRELIPIHREVLVLRFQEDMSYGEIALVTGCSIGTVRSRLHMAKRRLRDAMRRNAS